MPASSLRLHARRRQRRGAGDTLAETPSPLRVLVVDDNIDAAETLSTILEMDGHRTSVAHDGAAALTLAAQFAPDAVVLDIDLPLLSGFEVCRHLRSGARGDELLLIALTGWSGREHRTLLQEAGFDHHLLKPADAGQLSQLLSERRDARPS